MKTNRIYTILIMLMALSSNAIGQNLSVSSIEVEQGKQAELVINVDNISNMTALQFNLNLPKGVSLDETGITQGQAIANHNLSIRPLAGDARMFVIYSLSKAPIADGELLRLPVTLDSEVDVLNGSLNLVRTATPLAVSHKCEDVFFTIDSTDKPYLRGDVNEDGVVNGTDIQSVINLIVRSQYGEKADVNSDENVNGTDIQAIINIIVHTP